MPLLFTALLVILITQATAQQQQVLYRGANHRNAKFVRHAHTKLDVAPFLREKVEDLMECTFSCLQHAQCLSFNMAVKAVENTYDCLLLSTDKYSKAEMLKSTRDFNHHSIAVRYNPIWAIRSADRNGKPPINPSASFNSPYSLRSKTFLHVKMSYL